MKCLKFEIIYKYTKFSKKISKNTKNYHKIQKDFIKNKNIS